MWFHIVQTFGLFDTFFEEMCELFGHGFASVRTKLTLHYKYPNKVDLVLQTSEQN